MFSTNPRRHVEPASKSPRARACRVESLEDRRLLSGSSFSATVTGRLTFYDHSAFDCSPGADPSDLTAIPSKTAYLPGGGTITSASMTSYDKGINGIFVDITGAHGALSPSDFQFTMSDQGSGALNTNTPSNWTAAPAPSAFTVLSDTPAVGTDRVEFIWDDNAIENRYLEVETEGNDATGGFNTNTGLAASDIFYFGSIKGDTFNPDAPTVWLTTAADETAIQAKIISMATIDSVFDMDRNGVHLASDLLVARDNSIFALNKLSLGNPPAAPAPPGALPAEAVDQSHSSGTIDESHGVSPHAAMGSRSHCGGTVEVEVDLDFVAAGGTPLPEGEETDPGGFLALNDDDDDGDGTLDFMDDVVAGGDDDLAEIKLQTSAPPGQQIPPGTLTLSFPTSKVRVWQDQEKNDEVISGSTEFPVAADETLYVEGIDPSTSLADVQLTATYTPSGQGASQASNTVNLSVLDPVLDMAGDISADEGEFFAALGLEDDDLDLLALVDVVPVEFTIYRNDASVATMSDTMSDGVAVAQITISTNVGDRYRVEAEFLGADLKSDEITVTPGIPTSITYQLSKPGYVADGTDTITIAATVRDQFGNLVPDGTSVNWLLEDVRSHFEGSGSGVVTETTNGVAQATVVAPIVPGQQVARIRSGAAETIVTIDVAEVTLALAAPGTLNLAAQETGSVVLTTNAADGTKVFWLLSNGDVDSQESTVSGGIASFPLQAAGVFGRVGPAVVTATIGSKIEYTSVGFVTTAPVSLQLERFVLSGDKSADGSETINIPNAAPLPFAPQVVPNSTRTVPYFTRGQVTVRGTPNSIYFLDLPDSTSQSLAVLNGLDPSGRITLNSSGFGIIELASQGNLNPDPLAAQFANVQLRAQSVDPQTLEIDPGGPSTVATAKFVHHNWWTRTWDATQSFLGGDPQTGLGVAANFAGGMLIIGDVGSLAKNAWRGAGFSSTAPNYTEASLSGLGLLTELAVGAGELADAPISGVRSLLAALGNLPAGKILPVLYKRSISNSADMGRLVSFVARVTTDTSGTAFQVLKNVLTSEDVMLAAFKASEDFGDELFTTLQHISSNAAFGGLAAAHRITKLLAEVPGNARQFFLGLNPGDFERAIEHIGVVLSAGKIDAAMVQRLLEHDGLFSATYTRMELLADLRVVSDADGLHHWAKALFNPFPNAAPGHLYELQAVATILRNGGGTNVQWITKISRKANGQFDTDFDFIIDGVYYQAKRGWTGETADRARAWIEKALRDGAQDIKYVTPGGADAIPDNVRQVLQSSDNPFGAEIDILDVAIP